MIFDDGKISQFELDIFDEKEGVRESVPSIAERERSLSDFLASHALRMSDTLAV